MALSPGKISSPCKIAVMAGNFLPGKSLLGRLQIVSRCRRHPRATPSQLFPPTGCLLTWLTAVLMVMERLGKEGRRMRNKSLQDATKFNIVMIIPWTPCVGSLQQVENFVKEFGTSSHNTDMSLQFFSKLLPRVILEFNCVSSSGKWHQSCTVETRWQLLLFIKQQQKNPVLVLSKC